MTLQYYSDKLNGQFRYRWISTFVLACFYGIRVYLHGYVIITLFVGMILSGFLVQFLSSVIKSDDPDQDPSDGPPILPIKESDELRPFVPVLPEYNFWCCVHTVLCVALPLTFVPKLNPPTHPWVKYFYFGFWIVFTVVQLLLVQDRMIKYKYFPFYYGDKKNGEYKGK
ncbi:hypothetical protein CASFOL_020705 [Castilleja foliolosa]|uniref:Protein RER1 n=1 Tax=Castilleja foliolosa TaxID=1961234 RepID=A0ABD3D1L4_9LAMI